MSKNSNKSKLNQLMSWLETSKVIKPIITLYN
jgi:hypothetical protein